MEDGMSVGGVRCEVGSGRDEVRDQLLAGLPVTERIVELAGMATAVLEGGSGPPLVLLHGPCGNATHWADVLPDLVRRYRVIVPDLPGHGASGTGAVPLDRDRVLGWLDALIDHAGPGRPVLVGHTLGGAVAARYAVGGSDRLRRLILVDTFGLVPLQPAPDFAGALNDFLSDPSDTTHDRLWRYCAHDFGRLQERVATRWVPFRAYNVTRARTEGQQVALGALMAEFGGPPIPAAELDLISVPVTLIWGRGDLATPLAAAEDAAERHGWPLHVIADCADDPAVEAPAAFLDALEDSAAVPASPRSRR
jgi:pimeloyl-ACP methyl ester carboxylesterase